jgi:hypothetical protein
MTLSWSGVVVVAIIMDGPGAADVTLGLRAADIAVGASRLNWRPWRPGNRGPRSKWCFRKSASSVTGLGAMAEREWARAANGDVWQLGRHRLICGDSRSTATLDVLMNSERAVHRDSERAVGR